MSRKLKAWKFAKRVNSLAIPESAGAEYNILLKESCSLDAPVFLLSVNDFPCNYLFFEGKYYWLTDTKYIRNNLMEISANIDVLASYREEILNTTQHIARSTSNGNNDIVDTMLPSDLTIESAKVAGTVNALAKDGVYILNVAGTGGGDNVSGFTKAYGMSADRLRVLANSIYTLDNKAIDTLAKIFLSPFSSIVSVFWCPFNITSFGGGEESIAVGNVTLDVNGDAIVQRVHAETVILTIPGLRGDWRDFQLTQFELYLPCVGLVPVSARDIYGMSNISVECSFDILSGGISYRVMANNDDNRVVIGIYGANSAVTLPIAQNNNIGNGGTSLWSWIGKNLGTLSSGFAALSNFTGIESSYIPGLYRQGESTEVYIGGTPSASGSYSSISAIEFGTDIELYVSRMNTSENPMNANSVFGRPCGLTKKLSELSGYCQTINACVGVAGELSHNQKINAFLNGGVYIE